MRPAVAAALLLCGFAAPAPIRAGADEQHFGALLEALASPQWEVRQQAEDELVRYGPAAIEPLERLIDRGSDEESYARARSALLRIELERVSGPSLVRLHFEQAHPREVFEELARQGQTTLSTQPAGLWETRTWEPISVRLDRVPFWQAVEHLSEKAGLFPVLVGNLPGLVLADSPSHRLGATAPSGAFLVSVTRITRSAAVDLTQPQNISRQLQLHLSLVSEPKLRVLQFQGIEPHVIVDENGRSLLLPQRDAGSPVTSGSRNRIMRWNAVMHLQAEPEIGLRITRFMATARFLVMTSAERLELDDILKRSGTTHALAGRTISIVEVQELNNQVTLRMSVPRDTGDRGDWQLMQHLRNSAELIDSQGRILNRSGGATSTTPTHQEYRWQFNTMLPQGERSQGPYTLHLELPTDSRAVEVPFEFTDLPLP